MATTATTFVDTSVVLSNVSWETYENLLEDLADSSAPRLTYDQGVLEIMSPTPEHEKLNRTLNLIVEIVAAELDVRVQILGSTTFKREDRKRGFEPDSCFYVANAHRIRGKKRLDLAIDPAPDLVIEIDITSSSIPRTPIYAQFGVAEVWRYDGSSLRMSKLVGSDYVVTDQSLSFPILTCRVLEDFLTKSEEWEDHPRLVRAIRDWVAASR
ncbi:MAG: Uma2 family endonuclease [Vicinamibacteria bacterium]